MATALIGYTGFIGSNLATQFDFDDCFNSKNIEEIAGREYEVIVCCGMPGAKWLANKDPAKDRAAYDRLVGCLQQAEADRVVVISTIDVYPHAFNVTEDTPIEINDASPAYGKHRYMLEREAYELFSDVLVVRLPGMFGPGLRKNAIYDLLNNHETNKIHSEGSFQFYNVQRLWGDLEIARSMELRLVNFATEPVTIGEIAHDAFGIKFNNDTGSPPAKYDMRSVHAAIFGGENGYLYSKKQILQEIRKYVASEREAVK
jgi:nucleoside-diphosphate-sugar epimerase